MCSNDSSADDAPASADDVAAQLARAIDDCAAVARNPEEAADPRLAARLAALWAMLTDADPDLAARAARYIGPC
jgi:hypothetical protein